MNMDTARNARDLLRIALEMLDAEDSLVAAAMISGAINVLEGGQGTSSNLQFRRDVHPVPVAFDYRSCA